MRTLVAWGATASVMLVGLSACGEAATDPTSALRAVCGDDAELAESDSSVGYGAEHVVEALECEVDGHRAEARTFEDVDGSLGGVVVNDMDAYYSGDGQTFAWAVTPGLGVDSGVLVELFPLETGDADEAVLEPLADDGWETGSGYP